MRTARRARDQGQARIQDPVDPLVLMLALTNACNLACRHCYRDEAGAFSGELRPAEIFGLLEAFAELCQTEQRRGAVVFSGGEPLLHRDLGLAIRVVRGLGLHARVNTNATLATPAVAEGLAWWGLQVAQVSIDGSTPAVHEAIRGAGSWELTRRGIANLQAAGIAVELKVTLISGHNDDDPASFTQLAASWGVGTVSFARMIPVGAASGLAAFDSRSWLTVLERLARGRLPTVRCEVRDATFDRSFVLGVPHRGGSEEGHLLLAVDADGTCLVSRRMPIKLGNIRDQPLATLWHHPILERIRQEGPGGKCQDCDLAATCRGGSRAAAWASSGDALAPDPACWLTPEQLRGS